MHIHWSNLLFISSKKIFYFTNDSWQNVLPSSVEEMFNNSQSYILALYMSGSNHKTSAVFTIIIANCHI